MNALSLQELLSLRKKCRISVLVMIALLLLALVCFFVIRPVTFVLVVAAVLYHLLWNRRQEKTYLDAVIRTNLLRTVGRQLNTTQIAKDGGVLHQQDLRDADLLPVDEQDKLSRLFCGMSGTVDGLAVAVCDVSLAESYGGRGSRLQYSAGCWMSVTLPTHTGENWRFTDHTVFPARVRLDWAKKHPAMREVELAKEEQQQNSLFCANDSREPSPKVLTQLHLLQKYTPGNMAVSVQDDRLTVYLQGRVLVRSVKLSDEPTEKSLDFDPMPELAYVIRLAKVLCAARPQEEEKEEALPAEAAEENRA